jgi:type IV pilus assembly protein PilM
MDLKQTLKTMDFKQMLKTVDLKQMLKTVDLKQTLKIVDLKQILNLKKNEVCGLDIGTSAVKMVVMHKDDTGYKVTKAGISQIADRPNGLREPGKEQNSVDANVTRAIRDCFASTKLKVVNKSRVKLAVCGVCGPEIAVRDFEFPPLPKEEIDGAVSLEAGLVCPFNPEQAVVDYQLIPNSDNKTKGILVAATNTLIKGKRQIAQKAGLKCVLMDVDGLALLNCFNNLAGDHEKSTTAVLNVGSSYTTLAIMSDDGRPFIRDTACAGNHIVSRIAEADNIPAEAVMEIIFGDSSNGGTELGQRLEKACDELIADVAETLRFYAANEKSKPVEKIFVCGGFAPAKGFIELLSRRLGVEACLWNPFDSTLCHISDQDSDFFRKTGPAMAVAAGLAMRNIESPREK